MAPPRPRSPAAVRSPRPRPRLPQQRPRPHCHYLAIGCSRYATAAPSASVDAPPAASPAVSPTEGSEAKRLYTSLTRRPTNATAPPLLRLRTPADRVYHAGSMRSLRRRRHATRPRPHDSSSRYRYIRRTHCVPPPPADPSPFTYILRSPLVSHRHIGTHVSV